MLFDLEGVIWLLFATVAEVPPVVGFCQLLFFSY